MTKELTQRVLSVVGFVLTVVGCVGFCNSRRVFRAGQRAIAEVVDVVWRSASGKVTDAERGAYYPVVRFRAADGQIVQARTRTGRVPAPARVGEHIRVIYDAADPRIVAIDSPGGRGTMVSGLAVIAGVGVLVFQILHMAR